LRHLGEAAVVERVAGVWHYAFDRRVFAQARPDAWSILPKIACPTLVVRGEGSRIMDRAAMLRVATTVSRGQFAELKGAWHHLVLDDPLRLPRDRLVRAAHSSSHCRPGPFLTSLARARKLSLSSRPPRSNRRST
jgi:pimeloyl-ACP methyl ester carboxylesterase